MFLHWRKVGQHWVRLTDIGHRSCLGGFEVGSVVKIVELCCATPYCNVSKEAAASIWDVGVTVKPHDVTFPKAVNVTIPWESQASVSYDSWSSFVAAQCRQCCVQCVCLLSLLVEATRTHRSGFLPFTENTRECGYVTLCEVLSATVSSI